MHVRFENLPAHIQKEVKEHLQADNFREAKRLRDMYQTCHAKEKQVQKATQKQKLGNRMTAELSTG